MAKRSGRKSKPKELACPLREPYQPTGALERWGPGLLICLVAVAAYIPSLDNKFVSWDDDHYLYNNQQVILPDGIKSGLFDVFYYSDRKYQGHREEDRVSHQFYPLVFGIYWVEYRLYEVVFDEVTLPDRKYFKMNPNVATGFHVTSLLFHCLNVFLLIKLLRSLGMNTWVAGVAAALFALTPVNVASVAWAAERKNILSMMFYMLALMSYLRFRRIGGWYWYVGCVLLHQCALFSKTVAVTFPVMMILTDRLLDGRWSVMSIVRALPMIAQSSVAAWTTINVEDRQRTIPITDEQRPLVAAAAIWFYVLKSLVPVKLLPIYPLWKPSWAELGWYLPLFGLLIAMWGVWHWRRKIPAHAYWAIALFLVTQGPMLGLKNINYFQFAFVADHYFYNGGVGLLLVWALIGNALRARAVRVRVRRAVTVTAAAVALLFAVLTWQRCDDWQNAQSFWDKTIAGNPDCWPAYYNLGNQSLREAGAASRKGDKEAYNRRVNKALELYRKTIRAKPDLWQAYRNVIRIEHKRKRFAEAEKACRQFLKKIPNHAESNFWMGVLTHKQGKTDEAERYFQRQLRFRSHHQKDVLRKSQAYVSLATIYLYVEEKRDYDKAVHYLQQALKLNPQSEQAYLYLGPACTLLKKYDKAIEAYEHLLQLNPKRIETYLDIANAYGAQAQFDEAVQWCKKALKRKPKHAKARQALKYYTQRAKGGGH